jgi:hypothetical protein
MSKALRIAIFYLPIFVGLSLWELAARAGLLNPSLFPSLGDTLTAFGRLATKGHLLHHAELSLFRQSSGFFLAAFFGIASGILMAESRRMRNILEPLLRARSAHSSRRSGGRHRRMAASASFSSRKTAWGPRNFCFSAPKRISSSNIAMFW